MLDKRTHKLLERLTQICADGSYKVIEIVDLGVESVFLGQMLNYLAGNDMIDIKYTDEKVYCVSVLPKGRAIVEYEIKGNRGWLIIAASFVAAFVGSFIAGLL